MKRQRISKWIGILCACCLIAAAAFVFVTPGYAAVGAGKLILTRTDGALSEDDYTYENGLITIKGTGHYQLELSKDAEYSTDYVCIASPEGATVTLKGIWIEDFPKTHAAILIAEGAGKVTLVAEGNNALHAYGNYAALQKENTALLTITGEGTLTVTGGSNSAGIGSAAEKPVSNITISGTTITANTLVAEGYPEYCGGAGIGSGINGNAENITIINSTVTATGGTGGGAGIGGGHSGSAKNINIKDSTVTATGGIGGAGIGGGYEKGAEKITIDGGTIIAKTGEEEYGDKAAGAGIGAGHEASATEITIIDGTVNASGGSASYLNGIGAAGIGGGAGGSGDTIVIQGGNVTAKGGTGGAGIGGGSRKNNDTSTGNGTNITLSGGTTHAIAGTYSSESLSDPKNAAAIGKGHDGMTLNFHLSPPSGTYYSVLERSIDGAERPVYVDDWEDMELTISFTQFVPTPRIYPTDLVFKERTQVRISVVTEKATIYYTTDGSDPTRESAVYTEPFTLTKSAVVKAIAVEEGFHDSKIAQTAFTGLFPVHFDSQYADISIPDAWSDENGMVAAPLAPARADMVFGGWFTDKECEHAWDFTSDCVTEKMTLYASWIPYSFRVTAEGYEKTFPDFASALQEAGKLENPILQLLTDTETSLDLSSSVTTPLTIDLNSRKWKLSGPNLSIVNAPVTFTDRSAEKQGEITGDSAISVLQSTVVVEDGTYGIPFLIGEGESETKTPSSVLDVRGGSFLNIRFAAIETTSEPKELILRGGSIHLLDGDGTTDASIYLAEGKALQTMDESAYITPVAAALPYTDIKVVSAPIAPGPLTAEPMYSGKAEGIRASCIVAEGLLKEEVLQETTISWEVKNGTAPVSFPSGSFAERQELELPNHTYGDISASYTLTYRGFTVSSAPVQFAVYEPGTLFVGGREVTFSNCKDVFGDGTVTYDFATKTLTLHDAAITATSQAPGSPLAFCGIWAAQDLRIAAEGDNRIAVQSDLAESNVYGIYVKGNSLQLSGDALHINCNNNGKTEKCCGIYATGHAEGMSFTTTVQTLDVTASGATHNYGIQSADPKDRIHLSNGTVHIDADAQIVNEGSTTLGSFTLAEADSLDLAFANTSIEEEKKPNINGLLCMPQNTDIGEEFLAHFTGKGFIQVNAIDYSVQKYQVTVEGGTATPAAQHAGLAVTVAADETLPHFSNWTCADVVIDDADKTTTSFTMPKKDITVKANYLPHSWTYQQDKTGITAACASCDAMESIYMDVSGDFVYDGTRKQVPLIKEPEMLQSALKDATLTYYNIDKDVYEADTPVAAGNYLAILSIPEKEVEIEMRILKAPAALETPVAGALICNQTLENSTLNGGWTWKNKTQTVSYTDPTAVAAFTPSDTDNYDWTNIEGFDAESGIVERTITVPLTHAISQYEAKEPTCEEKGWEAYEACTHCDYSTRKEIPAKGHRFSETWSTNDDAHWHVCTVCQKETDKEAHRYTDFKDTTCDICPYERLLKPNMIEEPSGAVLKGSEACFTSDADFAHFLEVQVDNRTIRRDVDYTVVSGSTKVTLQKSFTETLEEGRHALVIISENGTAFAEFAIEGKKTPDTGDQNRSWLWKALVLLSLSSAAAGIFVRKKRERA